MRQFREWLYDGGDRARPCGTELDVSLCFAPLLRWVLSWWRSDRLALAIDPTLKGKETTAIVISVVYRGCAIPVAWRIMRANKPGAWMDPIVELLKALAPAPPEGMNVIVLCDRGLTSPKLWEQIRAQSLPPATTGESLRYPRLSAPREAAVRRGPSFPVRIPRGLAAPFSDATVKRRCTLIVVWYAEQEEPWIILTDHPPGEAGASWYALRFWIELGFKMLKSVGWQWQRTRRTSPERISRHWLVLSVTTLLALAYGTRVEDAFDRKISLRAPPKCRSTHRDSRSRPGRTVSLVRHGIGWLRRLMHRGRLWSRVWLLPEPWPELKPGLEIHCLAPT